ITDFYNGDYRFGPAIDYRQVLRYYEENAALVRLDAPQTAINERSLDYRIEEDIYAGYGMVSLAIGDLTAIGGVRVERTEGRYDAFSIRGATGITPLTFDKKYTDILPSVHLNYRPRPDVILRAAWTNTIGRPNYDASVPTFGDDGAGNGVAGNPDLEPYKSMGLDLSFEYYPDTDSIFSVGVFYKKLEDPIFTRTLRPASFNGVPLLSLSQPQNAEKGELLGVEVNLQRRFTFLPAPFDGLGASLNGAYIDSEVTVPERESEKIPFFRQSDFIANASLFFERGGFEARVAVNYRDDFIENVGTSIASDVYQKARTVIDARASYQVTRALTVFGSLSNLNEAPLAFYQTSRNQIFSREIYSFNGDVGVSLHF
ncbi:TonB-dependent receptor domain-containing protein, partial [uncultured Sphingomonas sp.]|uniref:TonB-dependent receptor domain-containing protein n=1 Tax=uncultured Sphingomonas sp. TaxID=158754 RepID=UPI0035CB653A